MSTDNYDIAARRARHTTCCCTETLNDLRDLRALQAAYKAALHGRNELAGRLNQALAERDRVRDTAARLEAELARREMETK